FAVTELDRHELVREPCVGRRETLANGGRVERSDRFVRDEKYARGFHRGEHAAHVIENAGADRAVVRSFRELNADGCARVLYVRSNGHRSFSAGEPADRSLSPDGPADGF